MQIGLIPLDERPVNTRYPAMIAAIGGARVVLPPPAILSAHRRPADCAALGVWLERMAPELDALIVACETLGYGGLIAARIGDDSAGAILSRLDVLRAIRRAHPALPIYGFSVITRVSNADDAIEEPVYWASHGTQLYRLSQLLDRRERGHDVAAEVAALERAVPAQLRTDFLRRRLRNHAVNAATLHLLAEGVLDLLVLSSDDTSPDGLPSREKRWLASWAELLGLNDQSLPRDRLLMYPGADEVGCTLLARLLNERAGAAPRIAAAYAPEAASANVAAYEDGPIQITVERQVQAIGGRLAGDAAEIWLAVNAPVARRAEWAPEHAAAERAERLAALQALLAEAGDQQRRGQLVAIADVAYPNGADPVLIELLQAQVDLPKLDAYGAWNTAGNTIGTVLAQACAALLARSAAQRAAQQRFLLHRFLEDWGYQQVVRAEIRAWLRDDHAAQEPPAALLGATCARIERRLDALIAQLPGFAGHYQIRPGSVRLPWARIFEVDFELDSMVVGSR